MHFRGPTATSTALSVAGTTTSAPAGRPGAFRERGMLDCAEVVAGSVVEAVAERAHAPTIRASTRPLQVSPSDTVRGAKYARSRDGGGWRGRLRVLLGFRSSRRIGSEPRQTATHWPLS